MNVQAWKGLWNYIGAHATMVTQVKGNNYFNEPIAFYLDDSDIVEQLRPYIMGRIVDLEAFISQYPFQNVEKELSLTFQVTDPLLPWNDGVFTLTLSPDQTNHIVKREEGTLPSFTLSIGTLTCLLLGYKRPKQLYIQEHIQGDYPCVRLLDTIVPAEKAYISDYI